MKTNVLGTTGPVTFDTPTGNKEIIKGYKSPMIDPTFRKKLVKNTNHVRKALSQEATASVDVGKHLAALKSQFEKIAKSRKKTTADTENAFSEYVQVQFDLGPNRASEYIRVFTELSNLNLNLEISKLVEVSRLDKNERKLFLKKNNKKMLAEKSCREVKELVRVFNSNKRNRPSKGAIKKSFSNSGYETAKRKIEHHLELKSEATQEVGVTESLTLTVNLIIQKIGKGKIPKDLCSEIDRLYKWKSKKQKHNL